MPESNRLRIDPFVVRMFTAEPSVSHAYDPTYASTSVMLLMLSTMALVSPCLRILSIWKLLLVGKFPLICTAFVPAPVGGPSMPSTCSPDAPKPLDGSLFAPIKTQFAKPSQCPLRTSVFDASNITAAIGTMEPAHAGGGGGSVLFAGSLIVHPFRPRVDLSPMYIPVVPSAQLVLGFPVYISAFKIGPKFCALWCTSTPTKL